MFVIVIVGVGMNVSVYDSMYMSVLYVYLCMYVVSCMYVSVCMYMSVNVCMFVCECVCIYA